VSKRKPLCELAIHVRIATTRPTGRVQIVRRKSSGRLLSARPQPNRPKPGHLIPLIEAIAVFTLTIRSDSVFQNCLPRDTRPVVHIAQKLDLQFADNVSSSQDFCL